MENDYIKKDAKTASTIAGIGENLSHQIRKPLLSLLNYSTSLTLFVNLKLGFNNFKCVNINIVKEIRQNIWNKN